MGGDTLKITCIICPLGCRVDVRIQNGEIVKMENLGCPRGEDYVKKEIKEPIRDFFTVIRVKGARIPVLPVRATKPVPKKRLLDLALELAKMVVVAPIKAGDIIYKNPLGLGVDIVATRDLDRLSRATKPGRLRA